MEQKSQLKAKKPLKAKAPLKQTKPKRKYVTKEKKTARQLMTSHTDKVFSKYIRLRDSVYKGGKDKKWVGTCITCSKTSTVAYMDSEGNLKFEKDWNAGHFISRGYLSLRFNEYNVNSQCVRCNKYKSGEYQKYKKALEDKYGKGTYQELEKLAEAEDAYKCPTKEEQFSIIHDCEEYINYCIKHPEMYEK